MPDSTQRLIRELFEGASDLPASERPAWIEARSQGNSEVVSSVLRLLKAAGASGETFLAEPAWKRERAPLQEGMMIGPYRVLRELGSGGMGVVYLAIRSDEVYRRLVALKVIRPELRANPIKDRFLREREILARLDHPNIARIIDGGATPDGLPYFVMDYIDGQPLDDYCRNNRATIEQRLNLFRQTCDAVQYLHDNDVLHRDLKPANILVTNTGQIKLLDFGISKPGGELSSTVTTGLPILTAGYASPEQISSKKLTAASDVYSLGVILYELLTGVRPLKLDGLSLPDILSTIATQTPVKPSTLRPLSAEADPGRSLATIRPRLAGDLDAILLMSLRKEPERRYKSAAQFAADIERFQTRLPVKARSDGKAYLAARTLRRHGLRIAAILLIAVSLTGGGIALYWAMDYRHQVQSLKNELEQAKSRQAHYRAFPITQSRAILQHDLNHIAKEIESKTPVILHSQLAPREMTRQLVQESLTYFSDATPQAVGDPATVAALGRAYLAAARTQWSADHASLNDPSAAARICVTALQTLSASDHSSANPEVRQVIANIASQLDQNPAVHQPPSSPQQ